MNNSRHFSHGKISHIKIKKVPHKDLTSLDLDANTGSLPDTEASEEHVPVFVEYSDEEDWYWRYGKERLYTEVFAGGANPQGDGISWIQLHCFVTNYAWISPKWRFLLDKPCWPLHTEVVDLVVMLYYGRRYYEQNQDKSTPRELMDALDLSKRLSEEAEPMLTNCKIETGKEGGNIYRFVHHTCDETTRVWTRSMLHRVLEFEGSPLPVRPVMKTTFNLGRFDEPTEGGGRKTKHT